MAEVVLPDHEQVAGAAAGRTAARPYPPSWIDRLTDWADRLPGPAWLYYLGAGVLLALVRAIVAWSDGSYPAGTFFHVHVLDVLNPVALLVVLTYLDEMAERALADFRSVLKVDDAGYDGLRYQITTMPSRPVFVLSLVGIIFGLTYIPLLLTEVDVQESKYFSSPASIAMDSLASVFFAILLVTMIYHTFHQLRMVSRIYTRHTNVSIFDIGPLYALSRVTATTTVAMLFFVYINLAFYGDWQGTSPVSGVTAVVFVLIALATFVWPLYGAHRLLQREKARSKSEVSRRMEAVSLEMHHRVDTKDFQGADALKGTLDGLIAERGVLDKVPTWPWDPEAVRAVVTALLLPVVLWAITRVLERLGF